MGALASKDQVKEVKARVKDLLKESEIVYGDLNDFEVKGASKTKGNFLAPMILRAKRGAEKVHTTEAFGPVASILTYKTIDQAIQLANKGQGSLVSTIVTFDPAIAREYTISARKKPSASDSSTLRRSVRPKRFGSTSLCSSGRS